MSEVLFEEKDVLLDKGASLEPDGPEKERFEGAANFDEGFDIEEFKLWFNLLEFPLKLELILLLVFDELFTEEFVTLSLDGSAFGTLRPNDRFVVKEG